MSFMHFAQTDKGKAEAGQRKVSRAVGTRGAKEALQFFEGKGILFFALKAFFLEWLFITIAYQLPPNLGTIHRSWRVLRIMTFDKNLKIDDFAFLAFEFWTRPGLF